jgi:hypothetical protein
VNGSRGGASADVPEMAGLSAYLSSQTSSMRQLLIMLLTIIVQPFTLGCQQ